MWSWNFRVPYVWWVLRNSADILSAEPHINMLIPSFNLFSQIYSVMVCLPDTTRSRWMGNSLQKAITLDTNKQLVSTSTLKEFLWYRSHKKPGSHCYMKALVMVTDSSRKEGLMPCAWRPSLIETAWSWSKVVAPTTTRHQYIPNEYRTRAVIQSSKSSSPFLPIVPWGKMESSVLTTKSMGLKIGLESAVWRRGVILRLASGLTINKFLFNRQQDCQTMLELGFVGILNLHKIAFSWTRSRCWEVAS